MDAHFVSIVQRLVDEKGREVLFDAVKAKAFLADYMHSAYEKERHWLLMAIEAGSAKEIANASDQEICKKQQIHFLQDNYFMDEALATETIELLACILHDDSNKSIEATQPQNIYSSPSPHSASSSLLPNGDMAKRVILFIWIILALDIIGLYLNYSELGLLQSMERGIEVSYKAIAYNDKVMMLCGSLHAIVFIVSAVAFLMWFYRAYYNLWQVSSNVSHAPKWAVWYWFIPIVALFKPFQIMRELYTKTIEILKPNFANIGTDALGLWWALWIFDNTVNNFSFRLAAKAQDIDSFIKINNIKIAENILSIALCLITIKVIKDYAVLESELSKRL
jgi:hypothetical protein